MTENCRICASPLEAPIYRSAEASSLTSMSTMIEQRTVVSVCGECGHIQTPPLDDIDEYYTSTYEILAASEEEDQLYEMVDGEPVYRADHQARTLLELTALPADARILDYGSAKGSTTLRVVESRPDLHPHFFDVTDRYVDFWRRVVDDEQWATGTVPPRWTSTFDLVASYFVLEHVERPVEVLTAMWSLLTPGGSVYLVVPNPGTNIADFVVVDHVNHFTGPSLERALAAAGFVDIMLSDDAHHGAWVGVARRPDSGAAEPAVSSWPVPPAVARANELAGYWSGISGAVRGAEAAVDGRPSAVYGAGFYGAFITANLRSLEPVVAVIDQNPFLQGEQRVGRPVIRPDQLDDMVLDVYVGLNPVIARAAMADIDAWTDRPMRFHFL